ncbi:MAG: SOS response-associated peptidase family protein [Gammaproteobacteria bacterium]
MLESGDWDAWLQSEANDAGALQNLLKPYPPEAMEAWPVSMKVNSPRYDSAECIELFDMPMTNK